MAKRLFTYSGKLDHPGSERPKDVYTDEEGYTIAVPAGLEGKALEKALAVRVGRIDFELRRRAMMTDKPAPKPRSEKIAVLNVLREEVYGNIRISYHQSNKQIGVFNHASGERIATCKSRKAELLASLVSGGSQGVLEDIVHGSIYPTLSPRKVAIRDLNNLLKDSGYEIVHEGGRYYLKD